MELNREVDLENQAFQLQEDRSNNLIEENKEQKNPQSEPSNFNPQEKQQQSQRGPATITS